MLRFIHFCAHFITTQQCYEDPDIPGIGELMLASFINSNTVFDNWCDEFVWNTAFTFFSYRWMGEKFDGIRAFWNFSAFMLYVYQCVAM